MHQQEIGGIPLLALYLRHTGGHGDGGDAGRADEGVDLAFGDDIHQVADEQTAGSGKDKGGQTHKDDLEGLGAQELIRSGSSAHGDAQEDGDDVHQGVLSGVGQTVGDAALLKQVAQHQAAQQGGHGGQHQTGDDGDHNGEENLLCLGDGAKLLHLDLAHLLGGQQTHNRRLNQGNQRHVGVGRNGNGAQQVGSQRFGQPNCGGAVGTADDSDGGGLRALEAQGNGTDQGDVDTKLSGSAQKHALGVCHHGAKVGHGAHAHKDQGGVDAKFDAQIKDVKESSVVQHGGKIHTGAAGGVPQLRVVDAGAGQVGQQHAEGNTHQQKGLELFDNA